MPSPVYADFLTRESAGRLAAVLRDVPHPVAVVGGHAVRLRVLEGWKRAFGTEYFGSRDIDIVYHVDPTWTVAEFRESAAGQAPARIREAGFSPMANNRFGVILDAEGRPLDKPPGPSKYVGIDYDTLYLDPLVTRMHPDARTVLGYVPTDEPLCEIVFDDPSQRSELPNLGANMFLPTAPVLAAMKLQSLPSRAKDDKAIKDLCDLYALVQYGGAREREVRAGVHRLLGARAPALVRSALDSEHAPTAARHLDVDERALRAVLAPLAIP